MNADRFSKESMGRRSFMGMGAGVGAVALATLASAREARADACAICHVINVIDEGADPTGERDSYIAIQTAINKAIDLEGEAAVLFPSGKYVISNTLTIAGPDATQTINNISLIGMRASIRLAGPKIAGKDIIRFTNASHCMVKDLYLSATFQSGHGIALVNAHRTILENVEIYQVGGNCLYADRAFWLSAYDCIFSTPGPNKYAVRHLSAMNNVSYYHCRFAGTSAYDRGGLFSAATQGSVLPEFTSAISIIACDFSFCRIGLKVQAGANMYVAGSYFEANVVGVQWGEAEGAVDPITNEQIAALGWPMCGTIDNCLFSSSSVSQPVVFIDVVRGTNLRINNPFFSGNGTDTTCVRVPLMPTDQELQGRLQRVVIDDVPYSQFVTAVISDPNPAAYKRIKRPTLVAYS